MANIAVEMTGDEARLWRSFQKIAQQQAQLDQGFDKVGRAGKAAGDKVDKAGKKMQGAGKKGKDAFGPRALGDLKGFAAGVGAITAAVGLATKAFNDMAQARQEAGENVRTAAGGLGPLAQLAGGDAAKLQQLTDVGKTLYKRGGAADLAEAFNTTFEIESAGGLHEWKFFADLYGLTDTAGLAASGGKLRAAFGSREAGSFRQLLSKGLAGAGPLANTTASQLLASTTDAAAFAKQLGLSDEELIAAVSVAGQKLKSVETGGAAVRGVMAKLVKEGYAANMQGASFGEMLADVRGKGMTEAEMVKWFGRVEAFSAFSALTPGDYGKRLQEVRGAQEAGLADKMIGAARKNDMLEGFRAHRIGKAQKEITEIAMGRDNLLAEGLQAEDTAFARAAGDHEVDIWLKNIIWSGKRWVMGDYGYLQQVLKQDPTGGEVDAMARQAVEPGAALPTPADALSAELNATMGRLNDTLRGFGNLMIGGPTLAAPDADR